MGGGPAEAASQLSRDLCARRRAESILARPACVGGGGRRGAGAAWWVGLAVQGDFLLGGGWGEKLVGRLVGPWRRAGKLFPSPLSFLHFPPSHGIATLQSPSTELAGSSCSCPLCSVTPAPPPPPHFWSFLLVVVGALLGFCFWFWPQEAVRSPAPLQSPCGERLQSAQLIFLPAPNCLPCRHLQGSCPKRP